MSPRPTISCRAMLAEAMAHIADRPLTSSLESVVQPTGQFSIAM
ncbi:Uncharacterised protein [Bordetella pertussis]|nr:Uncharacterised protein [Bordetella pertussis]CPK94755.1 Uncharacterised protein [Bordetella pertussis]CPM89032.1 Uncharacterised protein [Bordetella pertussis]